MRIAKSYTVKPHDGCELIAESFGITGGYVNRIVDIDIPDDWQVLYITGESGCGKTTSLREIAHALGTEIYAANLSGTSPIFSIYGTGEDEQAETIRLLTSVGISDAVLWMNSYNELSDSQQARMQVACAMHDSDIVIIDEFLSTLDRTTAKPVAYSVQKSIRKSGKRLVVTTAHDDLLEYLMPDYVVSGRAFPSQWEVSKYGVRPNPFVSKVEYRYGDKSDYRNERLGELHYKGKYTGGTKEHLFGYLGGRAIAVLVSTYNMHTGGRRISRVVVHPSYRGCGIGKRLVERYLSDYPDTDVVASMAMYNPIFDRAGMTRVQDVQVKPPATLKRDLAALGFDFERWYDREYLSAFCESQEARTAISRQAKKASMIVVPGGCGQTNRPSPTRLPPSLRRQGACSLPCDRGRWRSTSTRHGRLSASRAGKRLTSCLWTTATRFALSAMQPIMRRRTHERPAHHLLARTQPVDAHRRAASHGGAQVGARNHA